MQTLARPIGLGLAARGDVDEVTSWARRARDAGLDSVWVHDTAFYNNAVGLVSDSETDHPNYPENHMLFERNLVYDNNLKVYGANANIKATVFENSILIPVGVGVFLASGNDNLVQNNQIWGNDRYGVWLASAEGLVIGPTSTPAALPFASSANRFIGNRMYPPAILPDGASDKANGTGSPFGAGQAVEPVAD